MNGLYCKVTFHNLENVWLPEVRRAEPNAKILLVGTKADLRGKNGHHNPVTGSIRNQEVCIFFLGSGRDQKLVRPHPEIYSYVYIEMESAHLFGFHIGLYNGYY